MNPAAQAVICGHHRVQVSQTFTANASWTAPVTTSRVDTAVGKGANGSPASSFTLYYNDKYQFRVRHYANGGTNVGSSTRIAHDSASQFDPVPGNYCDPSNSGDDGSGPIVVNGTSYAMTSWEDCYHYERTYTTYSYSATTGASTTAFGQTFPGGVGGPAPTTTKTNVIVTPGASYSFVIPAGGSLTITYYQ